MAHDTQKIQKQLDQARQSLLDLTMRNRLLNYRPSKVKTIVVEKEKPCEIYDLLMLQERSMSFRPKSDETSDKNEKEPRLLDENEADGKTATELWTAPETDNGKNGKRANRFLDTLLDGEGLQRRLFHIAQQARTIIEEQGYTALFLGLGFLEWTEAPQSDQMRRAPLILVPVELSRTRVRSAFKLQWTGEDIQSNISLQTKVIEQGITLPLFENAETKEEVDSYLNVVQEAISEKTRWRVVEDVVLDFFSFTKFVMYRDLDPSAWPEDRVPSEHSLIQALLDPQTQVGSFDGFRETDVDAKLHGKDVYHIMDADPSQIAAIEDMKTGYNLVVEGPPGTGKSQTIANGIAELLACGKTVLFVSEKMAALEVVKSRLDQAGLGDFCLELHSRKARKREILQNLERTLNATAPQQVSIGEKIDRLEQLKKELNHYAEALRTPFGKLGRSPYALFCMKEDAAKHFESVGRNIPRIAISHPEICSSEQVREADTGLRQLAEIAAHITPVKAHPWWGCDPISMMPSDESEIGQLIAQALQTLEDLSQVIGPLCQTYRLRYPDSPGALIAMLKSAELLKSSYAIEPDILTHSGWERENPRADALLKTIEKFQKEQAKALDRFKPAILDGDVQAILKDYRDLSGKFFRFFYGRYSQIKRELKTYYKVAETDRVKIIEDLEQVNGVLKLHSEIQEETPYGKELFSSYWQGEQGNIRRLKEFAEWIVLFRKHLREGTIEEDSVELISKGIDSEHIAASIDLVSKAWKIFDTIWTALRSRVGLDETLAFDAAYETVSWIAMKKRLASWQKQVASIQRWGQYRALCRSVRDTVARPIVEATEQGQVLPEDILACFYGNFADDLLRQVFAERPPLAQFVPDIHESKIREFARLDRELIAWNRHRLLSTLFGRKPDIRSGVSAGSEAGILLGEINRKRGHMPIRKLMALVGGLVQKIKPCFMMSPLSIAQFLSPKTAKFDVIIFDEASQVRPEDALGALLRGKQVVVMGDTRQLPPTSFFDHMLEAEDDKDEDTATIADVESILHQCKRAFPGKMLRWHYRSRHESLIAVSNREFYDNQLLIYPSSIDRAEALGLQFVNVKDGVYDRGRSASNRIEARAVAKAAVAHYKKYPDKSLGIGTFNTRQQQTILEEIELQLRQHPEVEDLFSSARPEPFFVKNLETIQGDERDVIFLSVGYGFDAHGRLSLNFGPLNHEGGERRLNVLITRAKERCVVFANFRASDLSIDGSASRGLRALKLFLNYAETRILETSEVTGSDADSPFEESVCDFLESHGWEIRNQVGCAGFRVDLGIVDPKNAGRYFLGVECDGAKYHSSPVARDRDRLRQQILENLGWKIYRIWSTDWYRNRVESQKKLLSAVAQALQSPSNTSRIGDVDVPRPVVITRTEPERKPLFETVEEYRLCSSLDMFIYGEIHEQPVGDLADVVVEVVAVEGPVSMDEVVRRIRTLWGLKRSGVRIQKAIERAIEFARCKEQIAVKAKFLWQKGQDRAPVRRRTGDPPPRLELICPEEIEEAIKLVLDVQFATPVTELAKETARVFGFGQTTANISQGIEKIIEKMITKKSLEKRSDGMVCLPE